MDLKDLIRRYRRDNSMTMQDLADRSGLSKGYISMLEKGENPSTGEPIIPRLPTLKKLSSVLNVKLDELLLSVDSYVSAEALSTTKNTPSNELISRTVNIMRQLTEDGQTVIVNHAELVKASGNYDAPPSDTAEIVTYGSAAAGNGAFNECWQNGTYHIIKTENLPKHDFTVDVKGDSMAPTIKDGDVVFVKQSFDRLDNRIYVASIEDETIIKRCQFEDERLTFVSDNPDWSDRVIDGADLESVRFVGLVVGWTTPND